MLNALRLLANKRDMPSQSLTKIMLQACIDRAYGSTAFHTRCVLSMVTWQTRIPCGRSRVLDVVRIRCSMKG